MSREKFEAAFKTAKEKSDEEIRASLASDYQEEAEGMNKEFDSLKAEIPADILAVEEKKKRLAAIEGKPETTSEKEELFKVWRTVELGTGLKTAKDFETALKKSGREVGDYARKMLEEVEKEIKGAASFEKKEVELVEITPAELGLSKGGTLEQIYEAAEKKGLERCPAEVGPQSAIQYEDQPKGDYRLIGMSPVVDSDGGQRVFDVYRSDGGERWLDTYCRKPGRVWAPDDRFVFVRRKKSELSS